MTTPSFSEEETLQYLKGLPDELASFSNHLDAILYNQTTLPGNKEKIRPLVDRVVLAYHAYKELISALEEAHEV